MSRSETPEVIHKALIIFFTATAVLQVIFWNEVDFCFTSERQIQKTY